MASAGTVTVDFAAETAKFTSELKKVQGSLGNIEKQLTSFDKVGRLAFKFFTAGAILSFVKSAIQAGDALGDAAERAGIAVESFSRLQFAASRADVEVTAFTTGITKFQVAVSKASEGNKQALGTFSLLNIEISKLKDLSIEDQFATLADAFKGIKNPADRTRIAIELFGKAAGPQFVLFLAQGSEGMKKFTELADKLGITMTDSAAKGLDRATKATEGFIGALKQGIAVRFGDLVTGIFGSGDELVDAEFRLKNLKTLLEGLQGAPQPDTDRIRAITEEIRVLDIQVKGLKFSASTQFDLIPLPWINALEAIDLTQIQALKINVNELDDAFVHLNETIAQIQLARATEALSLTNDAVVENQRRIEQSVTADIEAELNNRTAARERARDLEVQLEASAQNAIRAQRAATLGAALGALQSFAGQSKKAAIAAVLLNKALSIAQAIQNTSVAYTKALTIDPTGATSARVAALGAAQVALIAATGIGEIQSINRNGGAPIGSPSNPAFVSNDTSTNQPGATPQSSIQVIIQGNVVGNQQFIDDLIDDIREAVDDKDVVLIRPTSRNAKEILAAT